MTKTIALAALLFGVGVARAQPAPPTPSPSPAPAEMTAEQKMAEAKRLYEKGISEYNLAKFSSAIESFTKAYELSQAPGLLFNIAQSYRLNKDYDKASYFYSTYLRLKPDAPNRQDVEQRIAEMDKALEDQKKIESRPPTGTVSPDGGTASGGTTTGGKTTTGGGAVTTTTTTTTTTTAVPKVAALEPKDDGQNDDQLGVHETTSTAPKLLSARMTGGIAVLHAGDLGIPIQPSFGIVGGYPVPAGPVTLELGAGVSYSPLPYEVMGAQMRGTMLGVRGVVAAVYAVTPQIVVRGEVGLGIASLSGLSDGNPITTTREAGSFTLPSFRVGVGADYLITPNLTATVSPFGLAFSPGKTGMYPDSIREIDVLFGIGYRQ